MQKKSSSDSSKISQNKNSITEIDWRFLLPLSSSQPFNHLVLLGAKPELADLILEVNLAKEISLEVPKNRCADALIILANSHAPLETSIGCLRRGGILYFESTVRWENLFNYRPITIDRFLEKKGFSDKVLFWALPNFENCEFYIPINSLDPLSWLIKSYFISRKFLHVLAFSFFNIILRLKINFLLYLAPSFAVTAIYDPPLWETRSILNLKIQSFWSKYRSFPIYPLMITRKGTNDLYRRMIVFPFTPGKEEPIATLKFWRTPERNLNSRNEQEALVKLRDTLNSEIAASVPKPLGIYEHQTLAVNVESCLLGCVSTTKLSRCDVSLHYKIDILEQVFTWLFEFQSRTQNGQIIWSDSAIQEWVEEPLKKYSECFKITPEEKLLFNTIVEKSHALKGLYLPLVGQHCDLNPGNIYSFSSKVSVIDWASGFTLGLPLIDAFYFVDTWLSEVFHGDDNVAHLQRFRKVFCLRNIDEYVERRIASCFVVYIDNLKFHPGFFPILLVHTWISHALYKFERGKKDRSNNIFSLYVNELGRNVENLFS